MSTLRTPSQVTPVPGAGHGTPPLAVRGPIVLAVAVLAGTAAAVLLGLRLTGAAAPSLIFDPGPLVRWGLPVVTAVCDLAAAGTIGILVLTAVALPVVAPAPETGHSVPSRAFGPGLRAVAVVCGAWTMATVVRAVLQYAQTSGTALTDPDFGHQLAGFLRGTDPGRGLLVTGLVAALITAVAAGGSTIGTAGFLSVLSLVALIPPALAGHAAGTSDHETAVTALGLHLLGVCVWVGGLAGLIFFRSRLGEALPLAVRRYSKLAGWAFVLVAGSGVVNAVIRVPDLSGLGSTYGVVLMLKVAALVLLGVAGALHRRRSLPDLDARVPGTFARLAAVELVVMGVATGLAAALAVSAPPASAATRRVPSLAESVTGYPLPPDPTPADWFTQWQPDLLWLVLAGLAAGLYLTGLIRLRARGDRWPVLRTVSWLTGVLLLVYVTCGPPVTYGRVLFSVHMLGHMALSMLVPMFLVLGGPVTLALRSITPRGDGSRGPREWLVATVESRYARLISFPPLAAFLFAGSLVFFYFSPLFGVALRTHVGHELMHVHFLFAGYLFAWVLIGVDPGPHRPSPPLRLVALLATMGFHAFFGVELMSASTVIQPAYFGGLGRIWGGSLLVDQRLGGGMAWAIGDIPAIALALVIAVQWARTDDREARRRDRAADRDGDAELVAYNAMLARIATVDATRRDQGEQR
jgi:cytochrome c oxidase assembly factor CtaG/putative copper export protein